VYLFCCGSILTLVVVSLVWSSKRQRPAECTPWLLILIYDLLKRSACTQFAETK
jgi:hypothetical protein